MIIKTQDLVHFTDEELKQLNQIYAKPFTDNSTESKVRRMLRYFPNNEPKERVIEDLQESIDRLKLAHTYLPIYEKALKQLKSI